MLLIERISQQRLDHCLSTNIQIPGGLIEFLKHGRGKVHIDALTRWHLAARIGEKAGDIFAAVSEFRNLIGGQWLG
jgi:hypothetical protein